MQSHDEFPPASPAVLTHEAIAADPIASLALPLPEQPAAELLDEAYFAARTVMDWTSDPAIERRAEGRIIEIDNLPGVADASDPGDREWHEEMALKYPAIAAWAEARAAEIDRQVEGKAGPGIVSRDAIAADPWNAVLLPLPPSPAATLAVSKDAHTAAEYCYEAAMDGFPANRAFSPDSGTAAGQLKPLEAADLAHARMVVLEAINPALQRMDPVGRKELPAADAAPVQGRADLDARVGELVKLAGAEDSLTVDAAALRQTMLTDAIRTAKGPQEAEALTRMQDAATQDFAAHLGTLASISLDAGGQHDDAAALRLEAEARTEIAASLRMPPDHAPPGSGRASQLDEQTVANMRLLEKIERDGGAEALIQAFKDGMTNWGKAEEAYEIAPGIYSIDTSSHGGFYLSPERYTQMPEQLRGCSFTKDRFFEESVSRVAVDLTFPDEIGTDREDALERYNADYLNELGPLDMTTLPPDHGPPGARMPVPEAEEINQPSDFRADAEQAARANGFGQSGAFVFTDEFPMTKEPGQGGYAVLRMLEINRGPDPSWVYEVTRNLSEAISLARREATLGNGATCPEEAEWQNVEGHVWREWQEVRPITEAVFLVLDAKRDKDHGNMFLTEINRHGSETDPYGLKGAPNLIQPPENNRSEGRDGASAMSPNDLTPPDQPPPGARMPVPEVEEINQPSDFRADAEQAARENGFGQSAKLVFMQPVTQEATMQGTNPTIVFEEGRASVAPGGNDYSALHAPAEVIEQRPTLEDFLAGIQAKQAAPEQDNQHQASLEGVQQPEATMTRIPTIGMGPGGAVLMEVNHSPDADVRTEALEATGYAEPFRPGAAIDAPQTVESSITNSQAEAAAPDTRPTLEDFLANVKKEIEGDRGGQEAETGIEAAAAFRSFGR